ncbi:hypothetical protein L6452_16245 [Arctium lappa]|uniref:Uncharacterized protein n=1 Tax=Arctium lappa TaxID=4217 RepID=A0ACB9C049_ARCLA|nr:hypothetical protein L6452_16245 [Arctium lappa]
MVGIEKERVRGEITGTTSIVGVALHHRRYTNLKGEQNERIRPCGFALWFVTDLEEEHPNRGSSMSTNTKKMEAEEEATNSVSPGSGSDSIHPISELCEEVDYHSDDDNSDRNRREPKSSLLTSSSSIDRKKMLSALETVERDSVAISNSFSSLIASLRLALTEVTGLTVDHIHCFNDAAGRLQESALDATTKGSRYINSCLRLNEETRGVKSLGMHIKILRKKIDVLDSSMNKLIRHRRH